MSGTGVLCNGRDIAQESTLERDFVKTAMEDANQKALGKRAR